MGSVYVSRILAEVAIPLAQFVYSSSIDPPPVRRAGAPHEVSPSEPGLAVR